MALLKEHGKELEFLARRHYISSVFDLFVQAGNYRDGYGILNPDGDDLSREPGWDEKSVAALADAVNAARETDFAQFLSNMEIPHVGKKQARALKRYLDDNSGELFPEYYPDADGKDLVGLLTSMVWAGFDLKNIKGIDGKVADSLTGWVENNLADPRLYYLDGDDPAREVISLLGQLHFND